MRYKVKASIRAHNAAHNSVCATSRLRYGRCLVHTDGKDDGTPVHNVLANARKRTNPLRFDPTRTAMIRRRFTSELRLRYRKLAASLRDFIVGKDALALSEHTTLLTLAAEREFQFRTDAGKLEAFNDWFKQQLDANIISVGPGGRSDKPWTADFVESSYKKGQLNAYLASKEGQLFEQAGVGDLSQEQFLRQAFNAPETVSKVKLLSTRTLEDLKGVNAQMAQRMNRILSQGLIDGSGPEKIARQMTKEIKKLSESRALTIARTEIINAHSEGQLDSFEELGVDELGVQAEWSTAQDDRVCPECEANEGKVFSVDDARGLIPLHPNCRCAWVPYIPPAKEEKKSSRKKKR